MKTLLPALRIYLFMTLLLGLIYTGVVTLIGQAAFPKQANGSMIEKDGKLIGSELIAQKFEREKYFWPRPSAVDYNPLPSGGSNLGPTSTGLKEAMTTRKTKLGDSAPQTLLFASGSGLDPELDRAGVEFQIARVAKARSVPEDLIRSIVQGRIEKRQFGFLGEERINILKLNLDLDKAR